MPDNSVFSQSKKLSTKTFLLLIIQRSLEELLFLSVYKLLLNVSVHKILRYKRAELGSAKFLIRRC